MYLWKGGKLNLPHKMNAETRCNDGYLEVEEVLDRVRVRVGVLATISEADRVRVRVGVLLILLKTHHYTWLLHSSDVVALCLPPFTGTLCSTPVSVPSSLS